MADDALEAGGGRQRADPAALACVLVTVLLWASAFPAIRVGLTLYTPTELAALRFAISSAVFGALIALRPDKRIRREHLVPVFGAGLMGIAGYHLLLNMGSVTVGAGPAAFIVNLCPIFVAVLASYFLRERLPLEAWIALLVCLSGVGLIALSRSGSSHIGIGALLILAGAFCQASQFVIQRGIVGEVKALVLTAYIVWAGTLFLVPFLPGAITTLLKSDRGSWDASIAALYLGIGPGLIAYVLWTYALQRMKASTASAGLFLVPLLSTLLAWVWLGERLSASAVAGGALVTAGVVLFSIGPAIPRRLIRSRPGSPSSVR